MTTHTSFAAPLRTSRPSATRILGESFQGLFRWLVDGTAIGLKPMQQTSLRNRLPTPVQGLRVPQMASRQGGVQPGIVRPSPMRLRVVRIHESGQACTSVGRMVISGRMADVCAELDRLVALDAAQDATLH